MQFLIPLLIFLCFAHFAWENYLKPRYDHSSPYENFNGKRGPRIEDPIEEEVGWKIIRVGAAIAFVVFLIIIILI